MSLFQTPEDHAANPPETWRVVKVGERRWALVSATTSDEQAMYAGDRIDAFDTKREGEQAKIDGWAANLWHQERRWYAGARIPGWKTWAECQAERERAAQRRAEREAVSA